MSEPTTAPFGAWQSPLTARALTESGIRLSEPRMDGETRLWLERRPQEGGRSVVVGLGPGDTEPGDWIPDGFDVRSRANEYGGGAWLARAGRLWFSNDPDRRVWTCARGEAPEPVTAESACRFADFVRDESHSRLIAVCEDHAAPGDEPEHRLVAISDDGTVTTLHRGHDFYASPALSADGGSLVWLTWDHPRLPWDGTELWRASIGRDGTLEGAERIAGGPGESVFQPGFCADGALVYVSDRSGWWNLYRADDSATHQPLWPMEAEFGLPQWVFGMRTWADDGAGHLACLYQRDATWHLGRIDTSSGRCETLDTGLESFDGIAASPTGMLSIGSGPATPAAVVWGRDGDWRTLRTSSRLDLDPAYISRPESVDFPSEGCDIAHALFYAPANPGFKGPDGEKPPVLVKLHGGPTAATGRGLDLSIQYWTSRGFAVVDMNYRGSTGYGRRYHEKLYGQWGEVDVDDCVNAVLWLAGDNKVDARRAAIRGGSAGGYTALAALAFRRFFAAGASLYGIGDLEVLVRDTHKFEARYLDQLIGPYPERASLYKARSPLHSAHKLEAPVIFFQGLDDKVVPPNQAEMMVDALKAKGVPVAYLSFEGEGHGFRKADTIERVLEAELYFYGRIFGFEPNDEIEPLEIMNLQ